MKDQISCLLVSRLSQRTSFCRKKKYGLLIVSMLYQSRKSQMSLTRSRSIGSWFLWFWYLCCFGGSSAFSRVTYQHDVEYKHLLSLGTNFSFLLKQIYFSVAQHYASSLFSLLNAEEIFWVEVNSRQISFLYEYLVCLLFIFMHQYRL